MKKSYLSPEIEWVEVIVELGFAGSGNSTEDWNEDDDPIEIG